MTKIPIAVAALVLLGACSGNKDTSNANSGAMSDSSAGNVNATTPPPSSTTPSATTTPPMSDSSSMGQGQMGSDTSKMAGRRGHKGKPDSSTTH